MKISFISIGLITTLLLLSCKSTPSGTEIAIGEDGFLAAYIKENPSIIVQKTTESDVYHQEDVEITYTGYTFSTQKDITVTEIGALVAKKGTYKFELYAGSPNSSEPEILYQDSLTIDNVDEFQYMETEPILLTAAGNYVLWYENENYESVYDLGLGFNQPDTTNMIFKPLFFNEVILYWNFSDFVAPGRYYTGEWNDGILRGLVDFKYQIME